LSFLADYFDEIYALAPSRYFSTRLVFDSLFPYYEEIEVLDDS
jgi:hypothetical protein